MMISSPMAARTIPRGLGQAVTPETLRSIQAMKPTPTCTGGPAAGCFPSWCSWMPFADFYDACKVPTAAQQAEYARQQIEKAAGAGTPQYNPELAAEQYQLYLADATAYCAMHPDECAEYTAAGENSTCTGILGAGRLAQSFCANKGTYLLAGLAIGGLLLWRAGK